MDNPTCQSTIVYHVPFQVLCETTGQRTVITCCTLGATCYTAERPGFLPNPNSLDGLKQVAFLQERYVVRLWKGFVTKFLDVHEEEAMCEPDSGPHRRQRFRSGFHQ